MATKKQERAVRMMVALAEKTGDIKGIKGEAMRQAGYSKFSVRKPKVLTESKAWPILLEKYLPDERLLQKHSEALEANKVISANVYPGGRNSKPINDFIEVSDQPTRLKAVELGYKVKGKMTNVQINQQFNFGEVLDDERKEFGV